MKKAKVVVARPVRVVSNGAINGHQWARIVDVKTGRTIHTGQLPYIKRIALAKYNALASL
jgi:hypothetical protein